MLPNTRDTNRRIEKMVARSHYGDANNENESGSEESNKSEDMLKSYEGTFMSKEFQNTYSNAGDNDNHTESGIQSSVREREREYEYSYPFENELVTDVMPKTFNTDKLKSCRVYVCIYRICKRSRSLPYLQYKLKTNATKTALEFPSFVHRFTLNDSTNLSAFMKRANDYVMKVTHDSESIEFKGMYHSVSTSELHPPAYSGVNGGKNRKRDKRGKHKRVNADDASTSNSDSDADTVSSESSDSASDSSDATSDSASDSSKSSSSDSYSNSDSESDDSKKESGPCDSLYLFYEDMFTNTSNDSDFSDAVNITSKSLWWWACIHEIFNTRRVLHYRVETHVTSFFKSQPIALFLVNEKGTIYESPHVLYKGLPNGVSLNEMRLFGPRTAVDDNNVSASRKKMLLEKNINELSLNGSYYNFYEYRDAVRGTCYSYNDGTNAYEKNNSPDCYVFRYAVFLGKMKMLMFDTKGTTNHVSIQNACMVRETKWPTAGYTSIYHGKYKYKTKSNHKLSSKEGNYKSSDLHPVFTVADPQLFIGLTYHEIDAASIPSDIELMFKRTKYMKLK